MSKYFLVYFIFFSDGTMETEQIEQPSAIACYKYKRDMYSKFVRRYPDEGVLITCSNMYIPEGVL